jgi:xylose isomerase
MDAFARALVTADNILQKSEYRKFRQERYASFDGGDGAAFAMAGKLSLKTCASMPFVNGEPEVRSGRQEWLENIINRYI